MAPVTKLRTYSKKSVPQKKNLSVDVFDALLAGNICKRKEAAQARKTKVRVKKIELKELPPPDENHHLIEDSVSRSWGLDDTFDRVCKAPNHQPVKQKPVLIKASNDSASHGDASVPVTPFNDESDVDNNSEGEILTQQRTLDKSVNVSLCIEKIPKNPECYKNISCLSSPSKDTTEVTDLEHKQNPDTSYEPLFNSAFKQCGKIKLHIASTPVVAAPNPVALPSPAIINETMSPIVKSISPKMLLESYEEIDKWNYKPPFDSIPSATTYTDTPKLKKVKQTVFKRVQKQQIKSKIRKSRKSVLIERGCSEEIELDPKLQLQPQVKLDKCLDIIGIEKSVNLSFLKNLNIGFYPAPNAALKNHLMAVEAYESSLRKLYCQLGKKVPVERLSSDLIEHSSTRYISLRKREVVVNDASQTKPKSKEATRREPSLVGKKSSERAHSSIYKDEKIGLPKQELMELPSAESTPIARLTRSKSRSSKSLSEKSRRETISPDVIPSTPLKRKAKRKAFESTASLASHVGNCTGAEVADASPNKSGKCSRNGSFKPGTDCDVEKVKDGVSFGDEEQDDETSDKTDVQMSYQVEDVFKIIGCSQLLLDHEAENVEPKENGSDATDFNNCDSRVVANDDDKNESVATSTSSAHAINSHGHSEMSTCGHSESDMESDHVNNGKNECMATNTSNSHETISHTREEMSESDTETDKIKDDLSISTTFKNKLPHVSDVKDGCTNVVNDAICFSLELTDKDEDDVNINYKSDSENASDVDNWFNHNITEEEDPSYSGQQNDYQYSICNKTDDEWERSSISYTNPKTNDTINTIPDVEANVNVDHDFLIYNDIDNDICGFSETVITVDSDSNSEHEFDFGEKKEEEMKLFKMSSAVTDKLLNYSESDHSYAKMFEVMGNVETIVIPSDDESDCQPDQTTKINAHGESMVVGDMKIDLTCTLNNNDIEDDLIDFSMLFQCTDDEFKEENVKEETSPTSPKEDAESIFQDTTLAIANESELDSSTVLEFKQPQLLRLRPGKMWRRSLLVLRRHTMLSTSDVCLANKGGICTCTKCKNTENSSACDKSIYQRRMSVRVVIPETSLDRSSHNITILESYASTTYGPDTTHDFSVYQEKATGEPLHSRNRTSIHEPAPVISSSITARDIVLRRCGQTEPLPFEECYPPSTLRNCFKLGEGVYGEVFLFRNSNGTGSSVMKVIPIEGTQMVNGEHQKKFEEILSEIIIAMELSNLRNGDVSKTSGFSEVQKVRCVKGRYPERLLELWDIYDETHHSENDSPEMFNDDQLYIVLELANGGKDLEAFVFNNATQVLALFKQIAFTLAVAESALQFEHRDLHWGNILISQTERNKKLNYCIEGQDLIVSTSGVEVSIIDFTLSRITYDGVCIFNDLSLDPDLFTATGDYQFEIYKLMQKHNGNEWQHFEPYTNILWLHYVLDKMSSTNAVRYKHTSTNVHKDGLKKLRQLKNNILQYCSVKEFVKNEYLF